MAARVVRARVPARPDLAGRLTSRVPARIFAGAAARCAREGLAVPPPKVLSAPVPGAVTSPHSQGTSFDERNTRDRWDRGSPADFGAGWGAAARAGTTATDRPAGRTGAGTGFAAGGSVRSARAERAGADG